MWKWIRDKALLNETEDLRLEICGLKGEIDLLVKGEVERVLKREIDHLKKICVLKEWVEICPAWNPSTRDALPSKGYVYSHNHSGYEVWVKPQKISKPSAKKPKFKAKSSKKGR